MPTYVYECSACNETYEVEQRIVEDPLKDCRCGSHGTVKRIIQPTAIMFKGSGFYVNDANKAAPTTTKSEETTTPVAAPAPAAAPESSPAAVKE